MVEGSMQDMASAWYQGLIRSDESAFEALFRTFHQGLVQFAIGLTGDEASARDVVQEAFIRIWRQRERLDPAGSPKALLFRTVRNLALNHRRDTARRQELLAEKYEAPAEVVPPPTLSTDEPSAADTLRIWVEELPDRQREALVLSRFEGLSHQEIADVMDLSARTVNNHLVRALRSLRERAAGAAHDR